MNPHDPYAHTEHHHPPCRGGCGELADECRCARPNPLGAFTVSAAMGTVTQPESGARCIAEPGRARAACIALTAEMPEIPCPCASDCAEAWRV